MTLSAIMTSRPLSLPTVSCWSSCFSVQILLQPCTKHSRGNSLLKIFMSSFAALSLPKTADVLSVDRATRCNVSSDNHVQQSPPILDSLCIRRSLRVFTDIKTVWTVDVDMQTRIDTAEVRRVDSRSRSLHRRNFLPCLHFTSTCSHTWSLIFH